MDEAALRIDWRGQVLDVLRVGNRKEASSRGLGLRLAKALIARSLMEASSQEAWHERSSMGM